MRCAHLFGLATILRLAFTAPFSISNTTNTTESPGSLQGEYYLMTSVIGDGNRDKNDLFVSGYHTGKFDSRKCFSTNKIDQVAGAGLNDVVLGNIDIASKGFINDTHQQFDYNTSFPWAFQMGGDTNYAAWELVAIDAGLGSEGFYFNSSLQWNVTYEGFDGWLACDWWHGLPQLFWKNVFYNDYIDGYPSSCASVNLVAVEV